VISEFTIELDRADATYRAGERVTGTVVLSAEGPEAPRFVQHPVDLTLEWRTRGSGTPAIGPRTTRRLAAVEGAHAGQTRRRFWIQLPSGPVSYHGTHLHVEWFLQASVAIPLARDPTIEVALEVKPAQERVLGGGGYRDPARVEPVRHTLGSKTPRAGSLVKSGQGGGLGLLLLGLWCLSVPYCDAHPFWSDWFGNLCTLGMGALFAVGGVLLIRTARRRRRLGRDLGQPMVQIDPPESAGGGEIQVRLELALRHAFRLVSATAELKGQEVVVHGSGSSSRTFSEVLHRHAVPLSPPVDLPPGEVGLQGVLTVPEGAPPTFGAPANELTWTVKVAHKLVHGAHRTESEWEAEYVVNVQPS